MITLDKLVDLWFVALSAQTAKEILDAKAEAEMQEICGCGARKSRQYDRAGNIINEPICTDCGV